MEGTKPGHRSEDEGVQSEDDLSKEESLQEDSDTTESTHRELDWDEIQRQILQRGIDTAPALPQASPLARWLVAIAATGMDTRGLFPSHEFCAEMEELRDFREQGPDCPFPLGVEKPLEGSHEEMKSWCKLELEIDGENISILDFLARGGARDLRAELARVGGTVEVKRTYMKDHGMQNRIWKCHANQQHTACIGHHVCGPHTRHDLGLDNAGFDEERAIVWSKLASDNHSQIEYDPSDERGSCFRRGVMYIDGCAEHHMDDSLDRLFRSIARDLIQAGLPMGQLQAAWPQLIQQDRVTSIPYWRQLLEKVPARSHYRTEVSGRERCTALEYGHVLFRPEFQLVDGRRNFFGPYGLELVLLFLDPREIENNPFLQVCIDQESQVMYVARPELD